MFKCALHDTYNYTLNILRVLLAHLAAIPETPGQAPSLLR